MNQYLHPLDADTYIYYNQEVPSIMNFKTKAILGITIGLLSSMTALVLYTTQTTYYPLTKPTTEKSLTMTPVFDPVYVLRNPAWHGNKLSVNIATQPAKVQNDVINNAKALQYPVSFNTDKNAVNIQLVNKLPNNVHALTENSGQTINIQSKYATKEKPAVVAKTITHELGHVLGLLHTNQGTIMYDSNSSPAKQPLMLNQSQMMYLHYLKNTTPITRITAKLLSNKWTPESANAFTIRSQPNKNMIVMGDKSLHSISFINISIVLSNLLFIWAFLAIIFSL